MDKNNWQNKTIVFSFIAIESLLLLISMIKPAFSSYFVFSRSPHKEIFSPDINSFDSSILHYQKDAPKALSSVNIGQVYFKQELDYFLVNKNRIVLLDSEDTKLTQISITTIWEIDNLIIMLVLGLILVRINQQIQHKSQSKQESPELNLSETQSSEQ